jgi:hypothetical protein
MSSAVRAVLGTTTLKLTSETDKVQRIDSRLMSLKVIDWLCQLTLPGSVGASDILGEIPNRDPVTRKSIIVSIDAIRENHTRAVRRAAYRKKASPNASQFHTQEAPAVAVMLTEAFKSHLMFVKMPCLPVVASARTFTRFQSGSADRLSVPRPSTRTPRE